MRKLYYATVDHPVHGLIWLCAYNDIQRSFTGMGDTPDDAYENLNEIEHLMMSVWPSPQLH